MKLLIIGDVFSSPGRTVLKQHLREIIKAHAVDFTIINGENASGGNGMTEKNAKELLALPVDVITMGNHVWNQKETEGYIDAYPAIIRPANYPEPCPGRGYGRFDCRGISIAVINLSGQVFMPALDCPFTAFEGIWREIEDADVCVVDFHGEATSEKIAFGYFADGKATAVVGTHTHVQTADARVLPGGTAYITDLGMTGALNGVIGVQKEIIIRNMRTKRQTRFVSEKAFPWQINGVVVDVDESTGKARSIQRIYEVYDK
jgi:metallophosphoesterase (TIGR00282 family)